MGGDGVVTTNFGTAEWLDDQQVPVVESKGFEGVIGDGVRHQPFKLNSRWWLVIGEVGAISVR